VSAGGRHRAEVAGYRGLWDAAPADLAARHGIAATDLRGGVCLAVGSAPGSRMLNHVVGAGIEEPVTEDDLDDLERFYEGLGARPCVAVADEAAGLRDRLEARGYAEDRPWLVFHRSAGPAPGPATDLRVTEAGPRSAAAFGGVVAAGFGMPPEFTGWFARLVGRPGWTCLIASDRGVPVGAAALLIAGGVAWFGLGAALPEHRGRGAQGALFAERARRAHAAGAADLVTETGAPLPGEGPGPSHRNMLRAGFRVVALRPNLLAPAA
jgi:hypothetical protein